LVFGGLLVGKVASRGVAVVRDRQSHSVVGLPRAALHDGLAAYEITPVAAFAAVPHHAVALHPSAAVDGGDKFLSKLPRVHTVPADNTASGFTGGATQRQANLTRHTWI